MIKEVKRREPTFFITDKAFFSGTRSHTLAKSRYITSTGSLLSTAVVQSFKEVIKFVNAEWSWIKPCYSLGKTYLLRKSDIQLFKMDSIIFQVIGGYLNALNLSPFLNIDVNESIVHIRQCVRFKG